MKSIINYVKEYGKYSFSELEFNDVDSLILAQISYLKFDGMVPSLSDNRSSVSFQDVFLSENFDLLFSDKRFEKHNRALYAAAKDSKRFSELRLNNYVSMLDKEWELQFSAMTFSFENTTFVAFRGTDETLVGWKEDFNMALKSPIPAQEKAVQYLNSVAANTRGDLIIGGHSKGGNLSVYAAMKCSEKFEGRIKRVYNLDGPGFRPEMLTEGDFDRIRDKVVKLIPHSSIVGMVLDSDEPYEVVECKNFGILQHDPYNWIVHKTDFIRVSSIYNYVALKDETLNRWVYSLNDEEIQTFVDQVYAVFTAGGTKTLLDIINNPAKSATAMFKAVEGMDEHSKSIMKIIVKRMFLIMGKTLKETVEVKIEEKMEKGPFT